METSTPRPSVRRMISSTGSAFVKSTTWSAPIRRAISMRSGTLSTAMIVVAPISRAPAVAHSPIGPCANTATVSPMRMRPLSAPEKPVDMMSGHISTCSSVSPSGTGREVGHGVGHQHVLGLAAVDGVAEAPAAHRLPAVLGAGPVLRMAAAQAGLAVPARRDRAGDDPLALAVALHGRAELLDHADRLMADGQALGRPDTRP